MQSASLVNAYKADFLQEDHLFLIYFSEQNHERLVDWANFNLCKLVHTLYRRKFSCMSMKHNEVVVLHSAYRTYTTGWKYFWRTFTSLCVWLSQKKILKYRIVSWMFYTCIVKKVENLKIRCTLRKNCTPLCSTIL